MLLLYGKPLKKIAQLRSADLNTTAEGIVTLRLGRGLTPLPEPLGMIALGLEGGELRPPGTDGWLFPGRHAARRAAKRACRRWIGDCLFVSPASLPGEVALRSEARCLWRRRISRAR